MVEIRVCQSCGLRYPFTTGHGFGPRCPDCLGETYVVLERQINGNEIFEKQTKKQAVVRAVLLDNIRSGWNVGSVFRSADGFGFKHAYLCGITPTPKIDAVRKTALGADEYITWSYHKDAVKLVKDLKGEGWTICALEADRRAIEISESRMMKTEKMVLIIGNEVTGVDPDLLDLANTIFYIPMHGQKGSFNVSVAFGVMGYTLST
jgi:23S rRNA (guanosine2251-2'-O)-methyltransferase